MVVVTRGLASLESTKVLLRVRVKVVCLYGVLLIEELVLALNAAVVVESIDIYTVSIYRRELETGARWIGRDDCRDGERVLRE